MRLLNHPTTNKGEGYMFPDTMDLQKLVMNCPDCGKTCAPVHVQNNNTITDMKCDCGFSAAMVHGQFVNTGKVVPVADAALTITDEIVTEENLHEEEENLVQENAPLEEELPATEPAETPPLEVTPEPTSEEEAKPLN